MPYAWGSKSFIQELTGERLESYQPLAELWMGAHPKASSQILNGNTLVNLHYIIAEDPCDFIGKKTAREYKDQLPFLLKVLAAEQPLSIQVHPNSKQAREGFLRENKLNVPMDSPLRNYKDEFHKPELIVALTEFHAMCGFREWHEIAHLFKKYLSKLNIEPINNFIHNPEEESFKQFYEFIMKADLNQQSELLENFLHHVHTAMPADPQEQLINEWSIKLSKMYPGDIGVISPLLLNIYVLKPWEGLYLEAGIIHSYLKGAGIEIMANSDNVLRGGLTPKNVDVEELLCVLDFSPHRIKTVTPCKISDSEQSYETPAKEFALSFIHHKKEQRTDFNASGSPEIIFCYDGSFEVENCSQILTLDKGQSLFIPYEVEGFSISGKGSIFRAKCKG